MPTYHEGDMWTVFDTVDHFIITPNSELFKEACKKFNGLERAFNTFLAVTDAYHAFKCTNKIGIMQTTLPDWDEDHVHVVSHNMKALHQLAEANPDKSYAVVRPGVNYPDFLFKGFLDSLPANVQVWRHGSI